MLAWDGKVTAPAPAIYWALFGLFPVKPHCSFPQLRPRLNCHGQDQSPEGHWLQRRGQQPPHHIYQEDVFFPSHLQRCEEKYFSCEPWPLSAVFFQCLELGTSLISCEPNTLLCIQMPYANRHTILCSATGQSFLVCTLKLICVFLRNR